MRRYINIGDVDVTLLKKQIKAVLESNMPEDMKEGTHMLLGKVLDEMEDSESYYITALSKKDIIQLFEDGDDEMKKQIPMVQNCLNKMDEADMSWFASKMADNYCNCCFWDSLRHLFIDNFFTDKFIEDFKKKSKFEDDIDEA